MDEYELLLRHAERWAGEKNRIFDADLLSTVLQLRSVHDGIPANRWPSRSASHVMLTRWPAHGPVDPPDVPTLVATLETFWRFLRNTGRMAGGSADPADLVREAKAAGRRMAAACADPAKYGQSKVLLGFGTELGISLDGAADEREVNERLQQIVQAWNELPEDERTRRMPSPGSAESRLGGAVTEAANHLETHGSLPEGWGLPDSPRLDVPDDEIMYPHDPAITAPQLRASGFIERVLALVDWVGEGREVTKTEVLRPAVAREAYTDLDLWQWEREWQSVDGFESSDDPVVDSVMASAALEGWRTAADCLPLDRLWLPALTVGLVQIEGSRATVDRRRIPDTDQGWVVLGGMLQLALATRAYPRIDLELLLGILMVLDGAPDVRHTAESFMEWWFARPGNPLKGLNNLEVARAMSDRQVRRCLGMFADCGLWTDDGSLRGTEWGWDFALMLISALDSGLLGGLE